MTPHWGVIGGVIWRVLKNNVIGRVLLTWSMQRSTPGSELPGLERQKDDLSPAFLHSVGNTGSVLHNVELSAGKARQSKARQSWNTMLFVVCSETTLGNTH